MCRFTPFLALVFAFAVSLGAAPPATAPVEPQYRTIARWYGKMNGWEHSYATREPGAFGTALSSPNSMQRTAVTVVLREEIDDVSGMQRTIVESMGWSSEVSDLYYQNPSGSRVGAGNGGRGAASLAEEQLLGERIPPNEEDLDQRRQQLEDAQQRIADAERELAEAKAEAQAKGSAAAVPDSLKEPVRQMQEARAAYDTTRSGTATQEQIDQANERFATANEAFQAAVQEQMQKAQDQYYPTIEKIAAKVQDPKTPDNEKIKLSDEIQKLSVQMTEAFNVLSNVSDSLYAQQRLADAEAQLQEARRDLRWQQAILHEVQNARVQKANADANITKNEQTGRYDVSVSFNVADDELLRFPVDVIPLKLVRFETQLDPERRQPRMWEAQIPRLHGVGYSGRTEADDLDEPVTISFAEHHQGGEPGLIGGSESDVKVTFTRVPVELQLIVRGEVLHRIRVPKDAADLNLITIEAAGPLPPDGAADAVAGDLAGKIPVAGKVRVDAWLTEPGTPISAHQPPDISASTNEQDGRFEFGVPIEPAKQLRLRFAYRNDVADLWEIVTTEVGIDQIMSAAGADATGAAPLPDVVRTDTGIFRFGNAPMEYPLGVERRGASVLRDRGQTILQFNGLNAILFSTFALRAPYLNQNLQGFSIDGVDVPAARIMRARPEFVSEAEVRGRLGLPASGDSPEETETSVAVRGSVVCFPTSVTMALGGLGLVEVQDRIAQSARVQELAQGVYDFHAERSRRQTRGPRYPEPPWVWPFPDDPTDVNEIVDQANQRMLASLRGLMFDYGGMLNDQRNLARIARMYDDWPFIPAGGNDLKKQWLISLESTPERVLMMTNTGTLVAEQLGTESLRPWQDANIVKDHLHDRFGAGAVRVAVRTEDPFASPQKVMNLLGRGGTAVISIDHKDSKGKKGGHIIVLVGAIIDGAGQIVRLLVHDPYGDQSRNPGVEGYYNPSNMSDRSVYDKDPNASWGAYAPYGSGINSWGGRIYGKYWVTFERPGTPNAQRVRDRLLPSQPTAQPAPVP